ncbi:hypothetical protein ACGLHS_07625 [Variovorax sp. VaC1]|uniref:hypothetical protein n=1 Tax=Variovorax sp. VaC1 TaxID=3373132 RepID=UPI003747E56B
MHEPTFSIEPSFNSTFEMKYRLSLVAALESDHLELAMTAGEFCNLGASVFREEKRIEKSRANDTFSVDLIDTLVSDKVALRLQNEFIGYP